MIERYEAAADGRQHLWVRVAEPIDHEDLHARLDALTGGSSSIRSLDGGRLLHIRLRGAVVLPVQVEQATRDTRTRTQAKQQRAAYERARAKVEQGPRAREAERLAAVEQDPDVRAALLRIAEAP